MNQLFPCCKRKAPKTFNEIPDHTQELLENVQNQKLVQDDELNPNDIIEKVPVKKKRFDGKLVHYKTGQTLQSLKRAMMKRIEANTWSFLPNQVFWIFEKGEDENVRLKRQALAMKSIKTIQRLHVHLNLNTRNYFRTTHDTCPRYIGETIKGLNTLKSVDIVFKQVSSGANQICEGLKRLKFVQNLNLTIHSSHNVPSGFTTCLKRLKFLKNISLKISGDFKCILQGLERLNCEQNLAIKFSQHTMTDEIIQGFGDSLKKLCSLRSLWLHFQLHNNLTETGLDNFIERIRGLSSLENLHFSLLRGFKIREVMGSLKKLSFLKSLDLAFSKMYDVGESPFFWVANCLKAFTSLQSLKLRFTSTMIEHNDKIFMTLSSSLKDLISLERISLTFENFAVLTETGICGFFDDLKMLSYLREMNIDFKGPNMMSEKGVQSIRRKLKGLKFLKKVKIQSEKSSFSIKCEDGK